MVATKFTGSIIFVAAVALLSTSISATEYTVGDGNGWTLNFDYQGWAQGKEFYVGDKLVFNYPPGKHNVLKVNGTGFQECIKPSADNLALASGNDVITLLASGKKWYICGVGTHCETGNMKLVINVLPQSMAPAAAPSSTGGSSSGTRRLMADQPGLFGFVAAAFLGILLLAFA